MDFRTIVETTNGNKYYPGLVSFSSSKTLPWTAPTASIEINTNTQSNTTGYMSPIRNGDIVRFQVNISTGKAVYHDLFEGRIDAISSSFGDNNLTILRCRGHTEELLYRSVTADYSESGETTGTMLASMIGSYLTRLTSSAAVDTTNSTSITSYNTQKHTKYMSDVITEMESLESYGYKFDVSPVYDSNGLLTSVPCSWQPVTQTVSSQVQIIEGTSRLISATFSDSIGKVVEHVVVYGASGTPQKSGSSVDGSPSYNTRYHIEVDSTLATDALCDDLSAAIRSRFGSNLISGKIRIHGTPHIDIGDLIYVRIPSLELNGATIDGNYRVKSLDHSITVKGWFINLEVGELIESASDMVAGFHAANRLTDAQFID